MTEELENAKDILSEGYTCVLKSGNRIITSDKKGISPLIFWLRDEQNPLKNAVVADKVIGRAAALLMVYGGVREVYGEIISELAFDVFKANDMPIYSFKTVPYIINREGDGMCPMEKLVTDTFDSKTAFEILGEALDKMRNKIK